MAAQVAGRWRHPLAGCLLSVVVLYAATRGANICCDFDFVMQTLASELPRLGVWLARRAAFAMPLAVLQSCLGAVANLR